MEAEEAEKVATEAEEADKAMTDNDVTATETEN